MTAVVVWDHQPDEDELLTSRMELGWLPTSSDVGQGGQVMGYGACAMKKPSLYGE